MHFNNINVVTKSRPIGDMITTHYHRAIQVLKALINQVSIHQSQGTPIIFQAAVVTRYCPTANPPNHGPNQYTPSVPRKQNQGTPTAGGVLDRLRQTKSAESYKKANTGQKPLTAKQTYSNRRQYVKANSMMARLSQIQQPNVVCALSA